MKVTLRLCDGRQMTFEDVEEIINSESKLKQVAEKPTEGIWFEVNPLAIDQNLFKQKRNDTRQEETRQLILEAIAEMKKNPKYTKPFKTMMPKKTWESKTVGELKKLASKLGDHNADWVEQALEWAQRIANGETWETVCNEKDTANWGRLVVWKSGCCRFVGGSHKNCNYHPASSVFSYGLYDHEDIVFCVPLVVLYKK